MNRVPAGNRVLHLILDAFGIIVIALMLCIGAQVLLGKLDWNPVATFSPALPLLGGAITLNSLIDLQWHMLCVVGLLPAALVWRMDRHVRVDFLYSNLGPRARAAIELIGHLLFTLPFLVMLLPASWTFAAEAFRTRETTISGGLTDLFLVKGLLPLGLLLLLAVVLLDVPRNLRALRGGL